MPTLGPTELIIIGVVLVLLFGATRLPQTAKGLGQALKIFKKEVRDDDKPAAPEVTTESTETTAKATTQANGSASTTSTQPAKDSESTSS
jgi:sec-independent protein translocase protein TatA